MGSLYRSEEMRYCQIIVEKDAAFACVAELGKKPYVEFKDFNADINSFQRIFVRDVRRFDEMERKLRFLENQIRKDNIPIVDSRWGQEIEVMSHHEINQLEQTLADLERDVTHMNDSDQQLKKNFLELKEWQHVLQKTEEFFAGRIDDVAIQEIAEQTRELDFGIPLRVEKEPMSYVVGVINHGKVNAFERVLWRACRRTAFLRHSEIEEDLEHPDTGEKIRESVFIVFYSGDKLRSIIDKVSEGFKAKQYNQCPKTSPDRLLALKQVMTNEQDMRTVMAQTRDHRLKVLNATAMNHRAWLKQVRIHKSIYHTLNLFTFDSIGKFFVAECWVPVREIPNVKSALEGVRSGGGYVKPIILNQLYSPELYVNPPTYNITNKFTAVFQSIVDAYGVADYQEINPAPYTIITFPFLFACMFGDLGHGALMFLCALYLVVRERNLEERQIRDEIFNMFFGGRYIILLMGLFSMHAGLLYNDVFAKSFCLFESHWRNPYPVKWLHEVSNHTHGHEAKLEIPAEYAFQRAMGPYPFGLDPIWNLAENKLNFLNSMKMKLSIILGIAQMTFGVALSLNNYKFWKSAIDIYTMFIPQLVFMACIFMYLCLQVILKWIFFWVKPDDILGYHYPGSHCAPSLLNGLINMFMFKSRPAGYVDEHNKQMDSCYLNQWYVGQSTIEALLVIIAFLCVPIMLFGKPAYILLKRRKAKRLVGDGMSVRVNMLKEETEVIQSNGVGEKREEAKVDKHEEESFGDIMVHQSIHTIEYVLGCISHTASYLRLWALSLAHAQLSDVLWKMILEKSFVTGGLVGSIATYCIFFAFGVLTFSILVLMEGLSAFLHALRLHWVEFQSKFYKGEGYPFTPFSFNDILAKASAADAAS